MRAKASLTAVFAVLLAGCTLGSPKKVAVATPVAPKPVVDPTPAPPPGPLSIPQTQVELPKPQPLDPAALPDESPVLTEPPVPPSPVVRNPRRVDSPKPAPQAEPATPPAATPAEQRPAFQEIVPAAELKRLQDRAIGRRNEANDILKQLSRRQQTTQKNAVDTIRSFLTLSLQAEKQNDMRQADALAERAQILAKELQSGK